ncbi:MAG: hypothetical protein ACKVP4_01115 [Hyphomicrobium sp.]
MRPDDLERKQAREQFLAAIRSVYATDLGDRYAVPLFTRSENAQNHCQVGNYGLALRTIVTWLDAMLLEGAERCQSTPEAELASIVSVRAF